MNWRDSILILTLIAVIISIIISSPASAKQKNEECLPGQASVGVDEQGDVICKDVSTQKTEPYCPCFDKKTLVDLLQSGDYPFYQVCLNVSDASDDAVQISACTTDSGDPGKCATGGLFFAYSSWDDTNVENKCELHDSNWASHPELRPSESLIREISSLDRLHCKDVIEMAAAEASIACVGF